MSSLTTFDHPHVSFDPLEPRRHPLWPPGTPSTFPMTPWDPLYVYHDPLVFLGPQSQRLIYRCPKNTHFPNCHFTKRGLREHGLPLPVGCLTVIWSQIASNPVSQNDNSERAFFGSPCIPGTQSLLQQEEVPKNPWELKLQHTLDPQ